MTPNRPADWYSEITAGTVTLTLRQNIERHEQLLAMQLICESSTPPKLLHKLIIIMWCCVWRECCVFSPNVMWLAEIRDIRIQSCEIIAKCRFIPRNTVWFPAKVDTLLITHLHAFYLELAYTLWSCVPNFQGHTIATCSQSETLCCTSHGRKKKCQWWLWGRSILSAES